MAAKLRAHDIRRHEAWAGKIVSALEARNTVVIGTDAAGIVLSHLAHQLIALHARRRDVVAKVEALMKTHPLYQVPTSMLGIGIRTAATFIAETLEQSFDTGAHLTSYVGLTPVIRHSDSPVRGEHTSHAGNKRLKRTAFLSTFVSLRSDPVSRAYYDHKIAQGKCHNQAVIALVHRRIPILHAMVRGAILYNSRPTYQLPTVA